MIDEAKKQERISELKNDLEKFRVNSRITNTVIDGFDRGVHGHVLNGISQLLLGKKFAAALKTAEIGV